MTVSACTWNCADSAIEDVAGRGVDAACMTCPSSNGGTRSTVAQFLVKVKTREEVLEYAGAFRQLYREEARYLERTVHYVRRVGLDTIKKKIVEDADNRKALWTRLQYALEGEPDPWKERAAGKDRVEYETLAEPA